MSAERSLREHRGVLLVLAVVLLAVAWFSFLDHRKLVRPDEGRYAEIAREMLVSGDFVTPRLNGIKYFEKPPLQYWITAAAMGAFGEHGWTARLWSATTGFLCVLLVALTAGRLFGPRPALLAGAVAASSFLLMGIAHANTLDMGFTFFMQASVSAFLFAQAAADGRGRRRWMLAAWVALGLAVLSKGVVPLVLAGGAVVLHALMTRDQDAWRRLELSRGLPAFALVTLPWFVAVSVANPEFPRFFFIHEHFQRYTTTVHGRYEPWWFFLPVLAAGLLPWTALLPAALRDAWKAPVRGFAAARFLAIYAGLVFVFFSASQSKLVSYILPMFPALAVLIGAWLASAPRRPVALNAAFLALLGGAGALLVPHVLDLVRSEATGAAISAYASWVRAGLLALLLGALASLAAQRQGRTTAAVLLLAGAAYVSESTLVLGHENLSASQSGYVMARTLRPLLDEDSPVYSVAGYDQTLPFYLDRTLTLVGYGNEFTFGLSLEPQRALPSIEAFKERWRAEPRAFAYMASETYDALQREGLPMKVVAGDSRRLVVGKP